MATYRTDSDAGRMAVNLAIHFFGAEVLARSTPTGAQGTEKLDESIMRQIMQLVLSKFGKRRTPEDRAELWSRCKTAIAQRWIPLGCCFRQQFTKFTATAKFMQYSNRHYIHRG